MRFSFSLKFLPVFPPSWNGNCRVRGSAFIRCFAYWFYIRREICLCSEPGAFACVFLHFLWIQFDDGHGRAVSECVPVFVFIRVNCELCMSGPARPENMCRKFQKVKKFSSVLTMCFCLAFGRVTPVSSLCCLLVSTGSPHPAHWYGTAYTLAVCEWKNFSPKIPFWWMKNCEQPKMDSMPIHFSWFYYLSTLTVVTITCAMRSLWRNIFACVCAFKLKEGRRRLRFRVLIYLFCFPFGLCVLCPSSNAVPLRWMADEEKEKKWKIKKHRSKRWESQTTREIDSLSIRWAKRHHLRILMRRNMNDTHRHRWHTAQHTHTNTVLPFNGRNSKAHLSAMKKPFRYKKKKNNLRIRGDDADTQ